MLLRIPPPRSRRLSAFSIGLVAGLIVALSISCTTPAQRARLRTLDDRVALRALVDRFSALADEKDVAAQVLLFTPDAELHVIRDGEPGSVLRGREQLARAFTPFLAQFPVVFHLNGQQVVDFDGADEARGRVYCRVTLIARDSTGAATRTEMGVTYRDRYRRVGGEWLIARRESHFTWSDTRTDR